MKVSFTYGQLNSPEQNAQSVHIRVKHNTLQFKQTLNLPILKEWWNFKTKHLLKSVEINNYESEQVYGQAQFMMNWYEREFYNEWTNIVSQIKGGVSLNNADWKNWCEKVISKVTAPVDLISEKPSITSLWNRYIVLKSDTGEHQASTTKTWTARLRAYKIFEEQNKKYNTDELDMQFYAELRKYILHIRQPKDELSELRTLNYFGDFINLSACLSQSVFNIDKLRTISFQLSPDLIETGLKLHS